MMSVQSAKPGLGRSLELSPRSIHAAANAGGPAGPLPARSPSSGSAEGSAEASAEASAPASAPAPASASASAPASASALTSASPAAMTSPTATNTANTAATGPPTAYHPGKLLESNSSHPIINHISVSKKWVLPPRPRPGRKPSSASSSQSDNRTHSDEKLTHLQHPDVSSRSISPQCNISKPINASRRKSKSTIPLMSNPDLITAKVLQLEEKLEAVLKCNKEQELNLCTRLTYANNEIRRLNNIVSDLKAQVRRSSVSVLNSPMSNPVSTDLLLAELSGDYALYDQNFTPTPPSQDSPFDSYSISSHDSYEPPILNHEIDYDCYQDPLDEFIHDPSSSGDEKVVPIDMATLYLNV